MRDNYRAVMDEIFISEGGYVDHPNDPGGATNYGITHHTLSSWVGRKVTKAEVRALTKEAARGIYRQRYWNVVRGNDLYYGFDMVATDGAVNSGPRRGVQWLQKGLGIAADGKVGSQTIAATHEADTSAIERACAARMGFLRSLRHWATFGRGWSRRVARVEAAAKDMWRKRTGVAASARAEAARREAAAAGHRARMETTKGSGAVAGTSGGTAVAATEYRTALEAAGPYVQVGLFVVIGLAVAAIAARAYMRSRHQQDRKEALEQFANG